MFASRNPHAFKVHQPDKENMIASQSSSGPFKTPMAQRTLHPSKGMGGGMHTVGPKRMQNDIKDGSKTEFKSRIAPSLNRNGGNMASPFLGNGKGKEVDNGKQMMGGTRTPFKSNMPKTPGLKQRNPHQLAETHTIISTPLPSATRARRRSRFSSSGSPNTPDQTPAKSLSVRPGGNDGFLKTPGPRGYDQDKYKTPCRPSAGAGYGSVLWSPDDEDLLEDDDKVSEEPRMGGFSLRLNDGVEQADLGRKLGQEVESLTEMMQDLEEEDDIEYMPPRAQELPHELPFDFTPLRLIGEGLNASIKGDYLVLLPGDEDDFDGYLNGEKWDVMDVGSGDTLEDKYAEKGLNSNGLKMRDLEEPFLARIQAARLRQEAKMKEIKEEPVSEASTATKPPVVAPATTMKRPLANGIRTTGGAVTRPPITQSGVTGAIANQTRVTKPIVTQSRATITRPTVSAAASTTRLGPSIRKPVIEGDATLKAQTTTIPARKPLVPTARPREQTTTRPVSSTTTTRLASSTTTRPGDRLASRSVATTKSIPGARRPIAGRTASTVPVTDKEPITVEIPKIEVFEVMDLESELADEVATLDFML